MTNPTDDNYSRDTLGFLPLASYVILPIWLGCGLMLLVARLAQSPCSSKVISSQTELPPLIS